MAQATSLADNQKKQGRFVEVRKIYVALLHEGVVNKKGEQIVTSITNLDVHDIARSCACFGVENFFVVNPLIGQKRFLDDILGFWKTKIAKAYNPDRVEALNITRYAKNLKEVINKIKNEDGEHPTTVTTTAKKMSGQITFESLKGLKTRSILLLFGTGGGLIQKLHNDADYVLTPLQGKKHYNHLSVRSAVAIVLDRLLSA